MKTEVTELLGIEYPTVSASKVLFLHSDYK